MTSLQKESSKLNTSMPTIFQYLDEIPLATLVFDENFKIVHWNYFLENWSKIKARDRLGKNIFEVCENLNSRKYKVRLENVLKGGPPATFSSLLHKYFIPIKLKNGLFASQTSTVKHLVDESTGQNYALVTIQDMTEIDKRNAQINKIQKELLEQVRLSNEALVEFAALVSHDLKAPLRAVHMYSEFLQEDCGSELKDEGQEYIQKIQRNVKLMNRLISSLFEYSRVGQMELAIKETDLNRVLGEICESLEPVLSHENATVTIEGELPTVICDYVRMTEVFRNLISNAIKYNDRSKKNVRVGVTKVDGTDTFYVKDNGIGIEPRHFDRVFKLFLKLHNDKKYQDSTGAGLAFVKKIIERHNGRVWIESEVDTGTTFFFTIETENTNKGHCDVVS